VPILHSNTYRPHDTTFARKGAMRPALSVTPSVAPSRLGLGSGIVTGWPARRAAAGGLTQPGGGAKSRGPARGWEGRAPRGKIPFTS